jgi:hypothetical protein
MTLLRLIDSHTGAEKYKGYVDLNAMLSVNKEGMQYVCEQLLSETIFFFFVESSEALKKANELQREQFAQSSIITATSNLSLSPPQKRKKTSDAFPISPKSYSHTKTQFTQVSCFTPSISNISGGKQQFLPILLLFTLQHQTLQ